MKILFLSIHRIIYKEKRCEQIIPKDGMMEFVEKLLNHVLKNENVQEYTGRDRSKVILQADAVLQLEAARVDGWKEQAQISADAIATHLLEIEAKVQEKIEPTGHEVQKGSLIQAVVRQEGTDHTRYILAKVGHIAFFDGDDYSLHNGFPEDEKQIWKTCVLKWKEAPTVSADIYSNTDAKYWWDSFLELDPVMSNAKNTQRVFQAISAVLNSAFSPYKKNAVANADHLYMYDYTIIKNAFISRLRRQEQVEYNELVHSVLDNYRPVFLSNRKLVQLKTDLLNASGFDKNFLPDPSSIEHKIEVRYSLGNGITLALQMGTYGLMDNLRAEQKELDGTLHIKFPIATADPFIIGMLNHQAAGEAEGDANEPE